MSTEHESESMASQYGELKIANEVVAVITALAATEVEGVAYLVGNLTHELIAKLGMKNLSRGVSVVVEDRVVSAQISLVIRYGYSVPEVSAKVQDKVKSAVENMTGLTVDSVKVTIAGVSME